MPSLGINPAVTTSKLKSRILNPSFTSVYSVIMAAPALGSSGPKLDSELFELTCMEASLPGSSIATVESNRDYHGIIERNAYSRLYDESIDLTFLVTLDSNYLQIRFFDYWMKWIVGESEYSDGQLANKINQRVKYPNSYKTTMAVVKYEKSLGSGKAYSGNVLVYRFVDVFPKAMNTIQVSYDASELLKVTVSMSYTRYYVDQTKSQLDPSFNIFSGNPNAPGNPEVAWNPDIDLGFNSRNYINSDETFNFNFDTSNITPFITDFNFFSP